MPESEAVAKILQGAKILEIGPKSTEAGRKSDTKKHATYRSEVFDVLRC